MFLPPKALLNALALSCYSIFREEKFSAYIKKGDIMTKSAIWSIAGLVVVIVAVVLIIIFVPNSSSSKKNTNSASNTKNTATINTIKSNFASFFAAGTTMSERQALLQNGSQFAQPMQSEFTALAGQKPSLTINSVTLSNATTAQVNYTVNLNGQPVLKDQKGEAVEVNGKWLVSDSTLCQLFSLSGSTPSICKNIS